MEKAFFPSGSHALAAGGGGVGGLNSQKEKEIGQEERCREERGERGERRERDKSTLREGKYMTNSNLPVKLNR